MSRSEAGGAEGAPGREVGLELMLSEKGGKEERSMSNFGVFPTLF